MKKINVQIKDKNTLALLEDACEGDIIDLTELESVDTTQILASLDASKERAIADKLDAAKKAALDSEAIKTLEMKSKYETEILKLKSEMNNILAVKESEMNAMKATMKNESDKEFQAMTLKIQEMENKIKSLNESNEMNKRLAVNEALMSAKDELQKKDIEIVKLKNEAENISNQAKLKEKDLNESFALKLKEKDEAISFYKDLKAKMSTKMLGETLEQHCLNSFEQVRAMAFPRAYFGKDNEVVDGTKGDFVFKDYAEDGTEIVSIMFEMKNEADTTATKHKNQDFLEKLDEDRRKKECEYAVLVSLLESDSDLYNSGIVDVSHQYPKMYVIRPQHFIPIISLIRNAALRSVETKRELELVKSQQIDVTSFENKLNDFKDGFAKNYESATTHFEKAIEDIDKSISALMKFKEELMTVGNQLRLANNKAADLTVKRLTYNNPTMKALFTEAKKDSK